MAIEATNIYVKHKELFDDEMKAFIRDRPLRADLKTMKPTATAAESRAINDVRGACLVMAGAGMCNGGRILHHLNGEPLEAKHARADRRLSGAGVARATAG